MVNLVPAKCPSCGAQLELDDNMKRAECKFCRSTIIVDEAIQKYQVELKGNVKVSGIQGESDKIDIAKKYIKLDKYDEAEKIIKEILDKDPFYLEALKMLIEIEKNKCEDALNGKAINGMTGNPELDKNAYNITIGKIVRETIKDCIDQLTTIEKLDEAHEYDNFVREYQKVFDELSKKTNEFIKKEDEEIIIIKQNREKREAIKKELIDKCDTYLKKNPVKNIQLLLQALKIDITKYGKNMCMIDKYDKLEDAAGGGYFLNRHVPEPYIVEISDIGITIGGIMLNREKDSKTDEYKYKDYYDESQFVYDWKKEKKLGYDYYLYETIRFERNEKISYEEQISILDNLISSASATSIFSKLFGK